MYVMKLLVPSFQRSENIGYKSPAEVTASVRFPDAEKPKGPREPASVPWQGRVDAPDDTCHLYRRLPLEHGRREYVARDHQTKINVRFEIGVNIGAEVRA
jgi:hypothetical protein